MMGWVYRTMLTPALAWIITRASVALRDYLITTAIPELETRAAATKNPYDDLFVRALQNVLGK